MTTPNERMTPERLAFLRRYVANNEAAPVWEQEPGSGMAAELLAELDAVRRERDEAQQTLMALEPEYDRVYNALNATIDAAAVVDDQLAKWRMYAVHLEGCAECSKSLDQLCAEGTKLMHATLPPRPPRNCHCGRLLTTALECPTHGPIGVGR